MGLQGACVSTPVCSAMYLRGVEDALDCRLARRLGLLCGLVLVTRPLACTCNATACEGAASSSIAASFASVEPVNEAVWPGSIMPICACRDPHKQCNSPPAMRPAPENSWKSPASSSSSVTPISAARRRRASLSVPCPTGQAPSYTHPGKDLAVNQKLLASLSVPCSARQAPHHNLPWHPAPVDTHAGTTPAHMPSSCT